MAAPSTSLAMTQLTFSRSMRASSNSELSLFLAFSALLAFCEAVESASSVSASFWVSFFLKESISVKNNVMKKLSPLRGPRHDKHCFRRFELKFRIPLWRYPPCEGCFYETKRDIGRAWSKCKGDQTKHPRVLRMRRQYSDFYTMTADFKSRNRCSGHARGPVLGGVWWLTAEGIRADKAAPQPAKKIKHQWGNKRDPEYFFGIVILQ